METYNAIKASNDHSKHGYKQCDKRFKWSKKTRIQTMRLKIQMITAHTGTNNAIKDSNLFVPVFAVTIWVFYRIACTRVCCNHLNLLSHYLYPWLPWTFESFIALFAPVFAVIIWIFYRIVCFHVWYDHLNLLSQITANTGANNAIKDSNDHTKHGNIQCDKRFKWSQQTWKHTMR